MSTLNQNTVLCVGRKNISRLIQFISAKTFDKNDPFTISYTRESERHVIYLRAIKLIRFLHMLTLGLKIFMRKCGLLEYLKNYSKFRNAEGASPGEKKIPKMGIGEEYGFQVRRLSAVNEGVRRVENGGRSEQCERTRTP